MVGLHCEKDTECSLYRTITNVGPGVELTEHTVNMEDEEDAVTTLEHFG